MFLVLLKKGKKQRAFQRACAILLLTLSFIDIAVIDLFVPEFCEKEGAIILMAKATQAISVENCNGAKCLPDATDTQPQNSSSPSEFGEDCFCCCSHILPSSHFSFPVLSIDPEQVGSITAFLSTSPPLKMFRPPRLA